MVSKGRETWREAIVNVLKDSREGLTSHEIVLRVRPSPNEVIDQDKVRAAVSATLSSGAKGDKPVFEKRSPNEANKIVWALKRIDNGSSSNPTNELLGEHFVTGEPDAAIIVATPREHESNDRPSMTNGGVSERGDQSVETNIEKNGDGATTPPEISSAATAQKIDFMIESAGLSPRTDGTDGPAAASEVEPSQQSHLHELQQTSPPLVDRREESSARELQPATHEGRDATIPDLPPGLVAEDRSVVAVPLTAPEMEPADVVVAEA
ncbi:hypothetical protein D6C93_10176 [Aureobasidium pullulans]|nr:hypothetical protein D6C93_10176 [Aureobasidium pullulans]